MQGVFYKFNESFQIKVLFSSSIRNAIRWSSTWCDFIGGDMMIRTCGKIVINIFLEKI
jgi:hypothetical protein